ncbi:hypothetical protein ACIBP6_09145 [Nonomuraea terrae]
MSCSDNVNVWFGVRHHHLVILMHASKESSPRLRAANGLASRVVR